MHEVDVQYKNQIHKNKAEAFELRNVAGSRGRGPSDAVLQLSARGGSTARLSPLHRARAGRPWRSHTARPLLPTHLLHTSPALPSQGGLHCPPVLAAARPHSQMPRAIIPHCCHCPCHCHCC